MAQSDIAGAALDAADAFLAIVAFDAPGLADMPETVAGAPCPVVLHFGTNTAPATADAAEALRPYLNQVNGSRLYIWPDAAPARSK